MKLIDRAVEIVMDRPIILREVVKGNLDWMIRNRYCPWHFGFETQRESLRNCGEGRAKECEECWKRAFTGMEKENRTDGDDHILVNEAAKPPRVPWCERPQVLVLGQDSRDNDVTYMCPVCEKKFSGWGSSMMPTNVYGSTSYCPLCKTELRF